jgi:hypothetical protein
MPLITTIFESAFSQSVLHDVLISTVSGLLVYLATALLHLRLPDFSVRVFWKGYARRLAVVTSEVRKAGVEPPMRPGATPVRLMNVGEAMAAGELGHFFRSRCHCNPPVVSVRTSPDFDRITDRNLLLIGGPKDNLATRLFLQEIAPDLYYQFKRLLPGMEGRVPERDLKVLVGRSADYPDLTYDYQQAIQYATVIFRKGLYADGKDVLCIAGLGNTATFAAVDWILERPASFWLRVSRQPKGFQAVIRCRALDQAKAAKVELVFVGEMR